MLILYYLVLFINFNKNEKFKFVSEFVRDGDQSNVTCDDHVSLFILFIYLFDKLNKFNMLSTSISIDHVTNPQCS